MRHPTPSAQQAVANSPSSSRGTNEGIPQSGQIPVSAVPRLISVGPASIASTPSLGSASRQSASPSSPRKRVRLDPAPLSQVANKIALIEAKLKFMDTQKFPAHLADFRDMLKEVREFAEGADAKKRASNARSTRKRRAMQEANRESPKPKSSPH